jgi:methyl-accepting chemotaxis protein
MEEVSSSAQELVDMACQLEESAQQFHIGEERDS